MDQFPDGTYMRLRSRVRSTSYLHADADGVGVSLRPLDRGEGALNAVWRVHRVLRDGIDYVLLHGAAYGRYLALSPDEKERAGGHDRGVPAIQRGYDARDLDAITWKPVAVAGANTGGYVLLRHVYNGNLRANGRFRPWSTRVTVEQYLGTETTMRHWTVEVVPPPRQGPPPALPLPTGASSAGCSKVSSSRAVGYNCTDPKAETDVETSATAARQGRYRDHEPHGSEALSSKVLSSRATRYNSTDPKVETDVDTSAMAGRQGQRYRDHEPHGSEVAIFSSSVPPSVDKSQRRLPTRIGSAKSSLLENIRLQGQSSQLQRGGADSDWRDAQVSRKKKTDTVSARISSASGSKLELIDAYEGGMPSAQFKKPLPISPRQPIRFHLPKRLAVLDGRGALDATTEYSTRESKMLGSSVFTWEGESYTTTLGPGGGYGYPHPPPFYKCEVCQEETAFYRLKCCLRVVCEYCSCACQAGEAEAGKLLQYQREELPKVKLEGSDLFLWQPCSFPDGQMLWKAKRTGNRLQYYFAPIDQLLDPQIDPVDVCVYEFFQQGQDVISLSKTDERLARNLLC